MYARMCAGFRYSYTIIFNSLWNYLQTSLLISLNVLADNNHNDNSTAYM